MPIRIYALAKDLKIDSKELVEVCNKAGITGKGSALASLDDDEVAKVKAFLIGGGKKPSAKKADAGPMKPQAPLRPEEDKVAAKGSGKIRVLTPKSPPKPVVEEPPAVEEPVEPTPEPVSEVKAEPATPVEPAAVEPAPVESPAAPKAPKASPAPLSLSPERPPPSDKPQRPPVLTPRPDPDKPDAPKRPRPKRKREPVIHLASVPDVKQPTVRPAADEPKAQKPEIRLQKDALQKNKRAPLEEMAKRGDRSSAAARGTVKPAGNVPVGDAPLGKGTSGRGRRGGGGAGTGKANEGSGGRGLAGMASARADRQKARRSRQRLGMDDGPRRGGRRLVRKGNNTAAPRKGRVTLELPCTVRSFSETTGVNAGLVLKTLMGMGTMGNINAQIDDETVQVLIEEMGLDVEVKEHSTLEDSVIQAIEEHEDDEGDLKERACVVTFLGHVDHGKTSLLDYFIGSNVVAGEAGGITQHIRAYQIDKDGRKISFVDTPGHEAFTEMRARGANVTDIAVLVIAADDGIMPQTEEAISHAKAAEVPIVVALNKIDLPGVDVNRVMTQMTEYELTPSAWGGDIEVVPTSAINGDGMDELLDTILTIADLHEYKANPKRSASGTCLEAEQEGGRGVIAKLIVQNGTLRVGDVVVCGAAHGRVKAMYDTLRPRHKVKRAGPSVPVNVTGLDTPPEAGDSFYVLDDIAKAREIASQRSNRSREQELGGTMSAISLEEFQRRLAEGRLSDSNEVVTLNLIVRADVRGSIEAIQKELSKLDHPEVQIQIRQASVGGITAADVTLAYATQAVIIGFNVIPDDAARSLADERNVEIRRYDVIYKVTDDIRALLEGKLKPEERVVELGHALVKQVFSISRVGAIAGCYVARGSIERGCRIRVNREGRTIGDYPLESLRREKDDTKEVPRGMECGIKLSGFNDVKKDDILEAYRIEEVARKL